MGHLHTCGFPPVAELPRLDVAADAHVSGGCGMQELEGILSADVLLPYAELVEADEQAR